MKKKILLFVTIFFCLLNAYGQVRKADIEGMFANVNIKASDIELLNYNSAVINTNGSISYAIMENKKTLDGGETMNISLTDTGILMEYTDSKGKKYYSQLFPYTSILHVTVKFKTLSIELFSGL